MNSGLFRVISSTFSPFTQIQFVPVRYRYYADKIARGPYSKKFGYRNKIFEKGPLGRLDDDVKIRGPIYKPQNAWSRERVARGQNDYIDLLGGGKLQPIQVSYDIPKWLRGVKGNEMQLLILKQKVYSHTSYAQERPKQWSKMSQRVKYLYNFLNRKTKTNVSRQ